MRTVDYDEATKLLAEIAGRDPDYVDPRANDGMDCEYLPTTDYRGCYIGQVLLKLNVPRWVLRQMDESAAEIGNHVDLLRENGLELTRDAVTVLVVAQRMQDQKQTWKVAHLAAEAVKQDIDERRRGL